MSKAFRLFKSYRAYIIAAFSMISAITAAMILAMVAIIFNIYFSSYTSENMEAIANYAATRIADEYERSLSLDSIDYDRLLGSLNVTEDAGIMVVDNNNSVFYDNTSNLSDDGSADVDDSLDLSSATQVAVASVIANGVNVGSVRIWVYGSDTLMSKPDLQFRNNTFEALILSGIAATLIAGVIGFVFSRTLVKPISRITRAANQFAEGNLEVRTGIKGDTEIERLGVAFDNMAESIERDRRMEVQLTSDVAHELRTPLMAIQATVEAMIDGVYETDAEHLALIDVEVQRLSKLVDALLKLSRLERRSQSLNESVVDLGELAREVVVTHEVFVHDSGLEIETHISGVVKTYCDSDMIRQAVANLISNAVRYTPKGGRIDVSVYEEREDAAGDSARLATASLKESDPYIPIKPGVWAVVSVSDTGIGLSPEEQRMVFSRFWRADAGRSTQKGGLGIGLSVVKEIITQHKGQIRVTGEKGVGSTFSLLLPAYDDERSKREAWAAIRSFERRNKQSGARGGGSLPLADSRQSVDVRLVPETLFVVPPKS